MSSWLFILLCVTITRDISFDLYTCLLPWVGSNNTVEIRRSSVAFFQTNTDTDNDEPHQLRSAATHVLQLRTFSPASTAGTTTRDEMIGILCGCPRLWSTKIRFFLSSFIIFLWKYLQLTYHYSYTIFKNYDFKRSIYLNRPDKIYICAIQL